MILVAFREHLKECIHLHVEEGIDGYRLQGFCYGAFACATHSIEQDDPGNSVHGTPSAFSKDVTRDQTPAST